MGILHITAAVHVLHVNALFILVYISGGKLQQVYLMFTQAVFVCMTLLLVPFL